MREPCVLSSTLYTLTIVLFVNRVNRERGCEAADVSAEQLVPSAHVR